MPVEEQEAMDAALEAILEVAEDFVGDDEGYPTDDETQMLRDIVGEAATESTTPTNNWDAYARAMGLTGNDYNPDQPRDEKGRFGSVDGGSSSSSHSEHAGFGAKVKADWQKAIGPVEQATFGVKTAIGAVGHAEHVASAYVKDKIAVAVAKLPPRGQAIVAGVFRAGKLATKAAFTTWIAGQNMAERVSREKGSTPEQAKKLRGVLSAIDVLAAKPVMVGLGATGQGHLAFGASFAPPATCAYLAYNAARHPLATIRAARGVVSDVASATKPEHSKVRGEWVKNLEAVVVNVTENAAHDWVTAIADACEAHDWSDWYLALFHAALDHAGNVHDALALANLAFERKPTSGNPQPQDDDEDAVFGPAPEGWEE